MCFVGPGRRSRVGPCHCSCLNNRCICNSTLRSTENEDMKLHYWLIEGRFWCAGKDLDKEEAQDRFVETSLLLKSFKRIPAVQLLTSQLGPFYMDKEGGQDCSASTKGGWEMQVQPPPRGPDTHRRWHGTVLWGVLALSACSSNCTGFALFFQMQAALFFFF